MSVVRIAVVEREGGRLAQRLRRNTPPGVDVVASGRLSELVRSPTFPTELVVITAEPDDEPEVVAARVAICRILDARVIVVAGHLDDETHQRLRGLGATIRRPEELGAALQAADHQDASRRGVPDPPSRRLSPAEARVLELCTAGASRAEVARQLSVSTETVKTLLSRARRKFVTVVPTADHRGAKGLP